MLGLAVISCKSHSDDDQMTEDIMDILEDYDSGTSTRCDDLSIDDFDSFLGVDFDTQEKELKDIMGKSSGGE